MPSASDLVQLATNLREEHIFVRAETQQLTRLNRQLAENTEQLYHEAWIARTQRRALECLMTIRSDLPADTCLVRLNAASVTKPVDGYRILGYKESAYGECLKVVRENPELLAECLVRGERSNPEKMQEALRIVMGSLYGYGLIPEDQEYSLKLLKSLIEIQLDANSNPRRLLKNISTFSYAYKIFVENLHETKLYLAAALHQPILQLLAEDDCFLDIDPSKLAHRFSPEERKKRFGDEGTELYKENLKRFRIYIVKRLVRLVQRFIQGLVNNLFCFPPSLCWIVSQVYERIQSQQPAQSTLPAVVCTDLIFSHFICPALVQPEPYALTSDIPVSHAARFNLMQVAQVLQTLAVSKWESIDPKLMDVYGAFEPGCMWQLLDKILDMRTSDIIVSPSSQADNSTRSAVIISVTELNFLIGFMKDTSADRPGSRVPSDIFRNLVTSLAPVEPPSTKDDQATPLIPVEPSHRSKIRQSKSADFSRHSLESGVSVDSGIAQTRKDSVSGESSQVMVISLGPKERGELGFLPEQKVLALSKRTAKKRTRFSEDQDPFAANFDAGSVDDEAMSAFSVCSSIPDSISLIGPGKRNSIPSRFDDTASVPSDALRVAGEEIGPQSVASSVDGGTADDNLSDDVSPSISAHASPSVSGRGTPSPPPNIPMIEPVIAMINRPIEPRDLPVTVQKSNREDVPEKFGKFYIPAVDETRSTVSDAWSTDVAASELDGFNDPPVLPVLPVVEPNPMEDPVFAMAAAGVFDSDDDRWSVEPAASVSNASQEPLEDRMAELENEPQIDPDLVNQRDQVLRDEDVVAFDVSPPVLSIAPGKYVSFANDDKFHHYPPENDLLLDFGNGGSNNLAKPFQLAKDEEDDDPTLNLPLNAFLPIPASSGMPGSVPSSCSSFSNLSGFSSLESDPVLGPLRPGIDGAGSSPSLSSFDPFAPLSFASAQPSPSAQKPPALPRKGSLTAADSSVPKLPASRQFSFKESLDNGKPDSLSAHHNPFGGHKKGGFLKSIATSFRGKQKGGRVSNKVDVSHNATPARGGNLVQLATESPDDILAKYRKKPADSAGSTPNGPSLSAVPSLGLLPVADSVENLCSVDFAGISEEVMLETAKRKVRICLNSFDTASVPCIKMRLMTGAIGNDPGLLSFLKIQLSEAIGLQDRSLIAQLHEAIRCVKALDVKGTRKLVEALRNDYHSRDVYTAYLIRCRKTLLNNLQHIDNLLRRTKRDGSVCSKFFISVCVKHFLEKRQREVAGFVKDFQRTSLFDEKIAVMESFLQHLYDLMSSEGLWKACTPDQGADARETLERQIMGMVYSSALYPNDEVDRERDRVLHEHIRKLALTLTPDHKDLKISKVFHLECPWPSAQAEIVEINAYKTPKDKVQCVVRCSITLMNLLSLAAESSVPAADDFMPALVYVLIRANPPHLLSTVQYVNNFYGNRLAGEESYWWTQFASAIEYVKNMDYFDDNAV